MQKGKESCAERVRGGLLGRQIYELGVNYLRKGWGLATSLAQINYKTVVGKQETRSVAEGEGDGWFSGIFVD